MIAIVGIVVIFVMVFGGYVSAGGKMAIIMHSLPHEMIIIGGCAAGAFLLANDMATVKQVAGDIGRIFKGPKWKAADYRDLLSLLFDLVRIARSNPVGLEEHVENPEGSSIFGRYPKIQHDHDAVELICDTLRAASMNYDDPHQVEEVLDKRMEEAHHHALHGSHALQGLADGMPAIGIVAAVLGVIKTMASIDQPPEILGGMIGGALVGTFLGVFLAYGLVGPIAARLKEITEEEGSFYQIIQSVLVAHLHGNAAQISVEIGRGSVPSGAQPSFLELEEALSAIPAEA